MLQITENSTQGSLNDKGKLVPQQGKSRGSADFRDA